MRAVNLLPSDRNAKKAQSSFGSFGPKPLLVTCGAVMLATVSGLVLMVWSSNSSVGAKQRQLDALQTKVAKLPAPVARTSLTPGAPALRSTVTSLVQSRLPWDGFLEAFSRVVPEDVWLQTMQAGSPGAAATLATAAAAAAAAAAPATGSSTATAAPAPTATVAVTPSTFTITGFTYSAPSVARLMRRLTLVPWLGNVNLVTSSKTTVNATTIYEFTLGASVVPRLQGAGT